MASIGTRKEQARDKPGIMVVHSATNTSKEGANGQDIDTSITKITKNSSETAMAHKPNTPVNGTPANKTTRAAGKPTVSFNSHPKADLMDLDTGEETTQPVLQFTASSTKEQPSHHTGEASSSFDQHIDALESSGILSAAHLEILKSIQTQVHARENATVPVEETPRSGGYTKSELVSLRPATAAPKVTTSIAKQFAEQQKAFLIGEHVHKTRYHTSASLAEDFENLSFSDKKPVKPTATKLPTTEKSTINPFGPAPAKAKGPSLPAHLLNKTPTADHGAAARVQYSGEDNALALTSTSLGDITATTGPTRRNMINQTGFIALAENRVDSVAAGKKGEDPLLVARN